MSKKHPRSTVRLENESIWLHMSFKYYLELLRANLYDEFWAAMETGAPYNMDLDVYGRSPLECGSFIVSSAYPDESMWGTSFLARLSGSTAEFLSIWLLVMAGPKPFTLDDSNQLRLDFRPALKADLFKEDGTVTFKFLGAIDVTYHNPNKLDAWDLTVDSIHLKESNDDDEPQKFDALTGTVAEDVRDLKYAAIDVFLK